jgi:hypothetical protein
MPLGHLDVIGRNRLSSFQVFIRDLPNNLSRDPHDDGTSGDPTIFRDHGPCRDDTLGTDL